jgi:ABC-type glutathione transport system ATPase component
VTASWSWTWDLLDLRKEYQTSWLSRRRVTALYGASLAVRPGERVGLIGLSGSGKTTLVRTGLGLVPADGGRISLFGEDTRSWSATDWRRARRRVQLLFQDSRAMLHPDLPIRVLLEESAALHRPEENRVEAATWALQAVSLEHRAHALPRELSGGERRRAGIARVLLARPQLLVADEPTAGLDAVLKLRMVQLLLDSVGPDCSVVVVTHDLAAVMPLLDRIVVLHEGRIVESFSREAVATGYQPLERCTAELLDASGFGGASW